MKRSFLLCLSVLIGCSGSDKGDGIGEGAWDEGAEISFEEQPNGDPVAGFDALVSKGYVSCGIPATFFPAAQTALGEIAQREILVDDQGEPLRTGDNADMPYNWNVHTIVEDGQDVKVASPNCLQCHASEFNGELIIGLGNNWADYTSGFGGGAGSTIIDLLKDTMISGKDSLIKLIERQEAISVQFKLPTIGTNPAVTIGIALASHRDAQTLAWLEQPHTPLPTEMLPIDVPPWWRIKKKSSQFYNGMSRGDHKGTMMLASMLCTDTNEEALEILSYFDDVHAYIRSIEAPVYPFAIDASMADKGEDIFVANCSGCHGTYGLTDDDDTYPNLLIPTDVVGTDPTMTDYQTDLADWFADTVYADFATIEMDEPFRGYVPPPLDGIWATAPFLHNGSVPNLEMLLNSPTRPTYWKKPAVFDSETLEQDVVGWPFEVVSVGHADAAQSERKYIYDTTLQGYSNEGHVYGDLLTSVERKQLIEYLKTL